MESVLAQTSDNWELLIVDDHSTDASIEAAEQAADGDRRIKIWKRRAATSGAPSCRNEGLDAASGEYALFLDSDDLLHEACIHSRLSRAKNLPEDDLIVFAAQFFAHEPGDRTETWCTESDDYLTSFLGRSNWQTSCVLWRTDYLHHIQGWKVGLPSWQDWELHVRALSHDPKFHVFPNDVDCYVRRDDQPRISLKSERDPLHLQARVGMLEDTRKSLDNAQLLNAPRKYNLVQQYLRVAVLQSVAGEKKVAKQTLGLVCKNQLVTSWQQYLLSSYVAFEANRVLRLPGLKQTLRKFLKLCFWTVLPEYLITTGKR